MPVFQKKWIIFCLVAASIFMSTLDSSIVNLALPYIMQDLKTDIETIQWVILIYLIVVSCLLLSFGRLSDIKGRKSVYITGFSIFTIGSLLCGMAGSAMFLIAARTVQGCGAAMLMACSPALIVDVFPARERGKALGMMGSIVAAGLTTGPAAGGLIIHYFSWHTIFYINIPIGLCATIGAVYLIKGEALEKEHPEPFDTKGTFLLIVTLSSLIVFLTQLPRWSLISQPSLIFFALFVLGGIGFILQEKNADYPLFDMDLLKIRLFILPLISLCTLFIALFIIIFMMPFFLTYLCGFSAYKTGLIMIVPFIFLLVLSPAAGMLYDRMGSRKICMTGMGFILLSLLSLMITSREMDIFSILWRLSLAGIGTALYTSPNNTAIMNSIPLHRRGIASGSVATARNLGMVIGVALAGLFFSTTYSALTNGGNLESYSDALAPFFMTAFKRTMFMGALFSMSGLILTFARGKEGVNAG